jgi:hypothetical protein
MWGLVQGVAGRTTPVPARTCHGGWEPRMLYGSGPSRGEKKWAFLSFYLFSFYFFSFYICSQIYTYIFAHFRSRPNNLNVILYSSS